MTGQRQQDIISNACWRHIGVLGDKPGTCSELARVIHCHNCDVFAKAARELFDRRARSGEQPLPLTATGDELVSHGDASLLPLRLGSTWIGIATEQVHLISQIAEVHRVPFRSNECVLGVVAVQGEVMPCISLSALLGVARDEKNQRRNTPGRYERMVVLNYGTLRVATAVDEVRDVTHFYFKELQEKVECSEAVRHFIKGELRVSQRGESYAIYKLDMTLLEQRIRKELA